MKYITQENAVGIINSIKESNFAAIHMADEEAVIFASTDPAYVGLKLPAAEHLLRSNATDLMVEEGSAFPASPVGYYFEIECMNEQLGVICVQGKPADILPYRQMMQRMVNILVQYYILDEQEQIKTRSLTFFLDEWFQLTPLSECTMFCERAKVLGVDLKTPRVIAIMHVHSMERGTALGGQSVSEFGRIMHSIFQLIRHQIDRINGDLCISSGNDVIFLLNCGSVDAALEKLKLIKSDIECKYAVSTNTGLSPVVSDYRDVGEYYRYALIATRVARQSNHGFQRYSNLSIELLLSNVQPQVKQSYIKKVFAQCSDAEIREWTNVLSIYFQYNGSIAATAGHLYMHKNTLQYKLNSFQAKTGLDPRNRSDSVILYLAVHILLENSIGLS